MQPQTYQGLLRGIEKLVGAVRPTLGPHPRMVALTSDTNRHHTPELLDDGGMIARRIVQLPDRDEDMGAMYLRHLLWKMREDYGDGTATLAVLFDEIVRQGVRYIVHGGNAMLLRKGLEEGARLVDRELYAMTAPAGGPEQLAQIAESVCADPAIAAELGEIFDTVGAYGHLELRKGNGRGLESEYLQGSFWKGELHSQTQATIPGERKAELENCAVLITDFNVEDMHQMVRMITEAKKAGADRLFLLCNGISEACIGFLNSPQTRSVLPVIAAKTPGAQFEEQTAAMEDLAVLTGGTPLTKNAGENLESTRASHFGRARGAWANDQYLGITGGQGDPLLVKRHIRVLKSRHAAVETSSARDLLRQRIGKLTGGSALLWVGGATDAEMAVRQDMASRAAEAVRGAMVKGVLPGGGMALLACKPALQEASEQAVQEEEKAAYRILMSAVEAPMRAILANAGLNPDAAMAEVRFTPGGRGYDARRRAVITAGGAGIFDSASVTQAAAHRAIAGAALLLTVDVLLRHKKPETVVEP